MNALKSRFKVGQTVYVKRHRYAGNRSTYDLVPTVLTKVGTKYAYGAEWWAKKVPLSSVYLTPEVYAAEVEQARANDQFRSYFREWRQAEAFTTEQIRSACTALGIELAVFAAGAKP